MNANIKNKIIPFDDLSLLRGKSQDQKIVHCHGVFDLLHYGHLCYLKSAAKYGDCVVVTLTQDRYVNKGPNRPHFNDIRRSEMMAALEIVDYVAISPNPTAVEAINLLKPDYYVKGSDYKNQSDDISGGILLEKTAVESHGGALVFTDDETNSSTGLLNTHFNLWNKSQKKIVEDINSTIGIDNLIGVLDDIQSTRVLIFGEPIIDHYVYCHPENLSSKNTSISANYHSEEYYAGGTLAIARHLAEMGCDVTLLLPHGTDHKIQEIIDQTHNELQINIIPIPLDNVVTPLKSRYISKNTKQHLFELTRLNMIDWRLCKKDEIVEQLNVLSEINDVMIIADFGHGLIEDDLLAHLQNLKIFTALNVQTNSGNYGYNFFHKHRHYDYLCIDERELRLGMHDNFLDMEKLTEQASQKHITAPFVVTMGAKGSLFFNDKGNKQFCPSFFTNTVDTIGAGDAFFALTSVLMSRGISGQPLSFLGNLFAGLKTQIIGNQSAVKRIDLIRSIKSILGQIT